jgi:hypothetical protein
MMEAARTSGTSVNFYQTIRRYNPENSHLHTFMFVSAIFTLYQSLSYSNKCSVSSGHPESRSCLVAVRLSCGETENKGNRTQLKHRLKPRNAKVLGSLIHAAKCQFVWFIACCAIRESNRILQQWKTEGNVSIVLTAIARHLVLIFFFFLYKDLGPLARSETVVKSTCHV